MYKISAVYFRRPNDNNKTKQKNKKSNIQTVKFIRTFGSVVTGIVLILFLFTDCDLTYRQEQIYKSFRGNVVLPFLYLYIHFTECL